MSKGYHEIVEPERLNGLFSRTQYFEFAVAIFYWLIQEVHVELKGQLVGVQIDVIKFVHHSPINAYPALGIHFENPTETRAQAQLIEETMARLLQERSALELVTFIGVNGIDWKELTTKLMSDEGK
jgi:hypothetical protein